MATSQTIQEERALVKALQAGDKQALERLYRSYSPALFGVVLRIVEKETVAEGILQETFVNIWQKIRTYDPQKGRLFTWMLNIARNKAIDYRRSAAFKASRNVQSFEDFVGMTERGPSAEMQVDHIGLREVMAGLKPELQQVLDFLYFKGYTQLEMAKETGIPLGTIKSRVKIALRELKKRMAT